MGTVWNEGLSIDLSLLNTIESLKRAEISAIEAKYQSIITELESKIKTTEIDKANVLKVHEKSLRTELEADNKMALAESKLELAEAKNKYNELLIKH